MGDLVRRVVKGGGMVIAGTDSPIFPVRARVPHRARAVCAEWADAVRSASDRDHSCGGRAWRGAESGIDRGGKLADLVILTGDPLADVKNARTVRTVIKNGEVHTVESLLKR